MAIATSSKATTDRKLYCGISNFKVVAINPSKAELAKMGREVDEEPVYTKETEGGWQKTQLSFFLKNDLCEATLVLFLENKEKYNQEATSCQWTNKYGQFTYAATADEAINRTAAKSGKKWFNEENVTEALIGQQALVDFIRVWCGLKFSDECQLDTIRKIACGDIKELKSVFKLKSANEVKCLLGVQAGKGGKVYQTVYSKYFESPTCKSSNGFKEALSAKYGAFKADFMGDFKFQEWQENTSFNMATDSKSGEDTQSSFFTT